MNKNERGFILLESLVGLAILSTIILTLLQILPIMIEAKSQIEIEKTIYNTLYMIYDQQTFYSQNYPNVLYYDEPVSYFIKPNESPLCAIYLWRDQNEKKICL